MEATGECVFEELSAELDRDDKSSNNEQNKARNCGAFCIVGWVDIIRRWKALLVRKKACIKPHYEEEGDEEITDANVTTKCQAGMKARSSRSLK